MPTGLLTTPQRDEFTAEGLTRLDGTGVPDGTLDAIVASLRDAYPADGDYERDGVAYFHDRIMDAWRVNEHVRALAQSPAILEVLESLFGRKPLPFQTLNFRRGTQQRAHSDAFHFNSNPTGFLCAVWVALEDIDVDNGPVVYYPGSHRNSEVAVPGLPAPVNSVDYELYDEYVRGQIESAGLRPAYGVVRRGQALVWSGNLLHGGAPLADPARTRFSQVTHYFFEGCEYWVPKLSGPGERCLKTPTWIV